MPFAACLDVYKALWAAGEAHGIADYGSFAMNAMRMEKAFKGAGELTNEVTLAEADALRFARTDKDYLGRELTMNQDLPWICAYLEIEPDGEVDGHGGEAVLMDGRVVGSTASVAYGHAVGKILAFAYVKPAAAKPGAALTVVIHGEPRAARVPGAPAYDPASLRPGPMALVQTLSSAGPMSAGGGGGGGPSGLVDPPLVAASAPPQPEPEEPVIDIVINNVVSSFSVSCHLDLDDLHKGFVVAYHRKMERQEAYLLSAQKTRPLLFGLPVMVQCGAEVSGAELYRAVWTQVARLVSPLPPASELGLANHAQDW